MYANKYSGSGIATGGPKEGFAGRYHVRYFYDSGEFSDEYDLIIEKTGDAYQVSWISKAGAELRISCHPRAVWRATGVHCRGRVHNAFFE